MGLDTMQPKLKEEMQLRLEMKTKENLWILFVLLFLNYIARLTTLKGERW